MKKILFRADASSVIGLGHVMRDLVLAQELRQYHDVMFATRSLQGNINDRITANAFNLHVLHSNRVDELVDVIHQYSIDTVVIDHYGIDTSFERELQERSGVYIVVFDDMYRQHYCDVLLNHNPGAQAYRYKSLVPSHARILCGITYTLIRDEFKRIRAQHAREHRMLYKRRMKVLIMMGGSDPQNSTYAIAKELVRNTPYELHIVTTTSNRHLALLQQIAQRHVAIHLHVNSRHVAVLMQHADIAIISASVTAAEALYMRLPFIAVQTADNQHEITTYLKQQRLPVLEKYSPMRLKRALHQCTQNYDNIVRRLKRFYFANKSVECMI